MGHELCSLSHSPPLPIVSFDSHEISVEQMALLLLSFADKDIEVPTREETSQRTCNCRRWNGCEPSSVRHQRLRALPHAEL